MRVGVLIQPQVFQKLYLGTYERTDVAAPDSASRVKPGPPRAQAASQPQPASGMGRLSLWATEMERKSNFYLCLIFYLILSRNTYMCFLTYIM